MAYFSIIFESARLDNLNEIYPVLVVIRKTFCVHDVRNHKTSEKINKSHHI